MEWDMNMERTKTIKVCNSGIRIFSNTVGFIFTESSFAETTTIYVDNSSTERSRDGIHLPSYQEINDGIAVANASNTVFILSGTNTENVL